MPIYEYLCNRCNETIEALQRMSDPPLKKHAGCGGTLTRLLSIPAVHFKDTGGFSEEALKHPAVQQQAENEKRAREKSRKSPKVVSGSGLRSTAGSSRKKTKKA
jgi:putative FmdB family regulatory protein